MPVNEGVRPRDSHRPARQHTWWSLAALVGVALGVILGSGVLTGNVVFNLMPGLTPPPTLDPSFHCPTSDDVTTVVNTTVSRSPQQVDVDTAVTVTMRNTNPVEPINALTAGAHASLDDRDKLSRCLLPDPFALHSFEWQHGTLVAHFATPPASLGAYRSASFVPLGTPGAGVVITPGQEAPDLELNVALCSPPRPTPSLQHGNAPRTATACQPRARTTLTVVLDNIAGIPNRAAQQATTGPGGDPRAGSMVSDIDAPMPNIANEEHGKSTYTWDFVGPPTPVKFDLVVPLRWSLGARLTATAPRFGPTVVAIGPLVGTFVTALPVALAAWTMRKVRKPAARGVAVRAGTIVLAATVMSSFSWGSRYWITHMAVTGICWALVTMAVTTGRRNRLFSLGLCGVLLGTLIWSAYLTSWKTWGSTTHLTLLAVLVLASFVAVVAAASVGVTAVVARVVSGLQLCSTVTTPTHRTVTAVGAVSIFGAFMFIAAFVSATIAGQGSVITASAASYPAAVPDWVAILLSSSQVSVSLAIANAVLIGCLPLIALAFLARGWVERFGESRAAAEQLAEHGHRVGTSFVGKLNNLKFPIGGTIALLMAVAAPWSDITGIQSVIPIPTWLIQFAALCLWVKWLFARQVATTDRADLGWKWPPAAFSNERRTLMTKLWNAPQLRRDGSYKPEDARRLLQLGPRDTALSNARTAASCAACLAVAPVAYMVATSIQASNMVLEGWPFAAFVAVVAMLSEGARWIITGFVFGYLYPRLPGKTGPGKGLAFFAGWAACSGVALLFAKIAGVAVATTTAYRIAEFLAFVVVLGITYDWCTVRRSDGTWRDLRQIYVRSNYLQIAGVAAPLLISVITLVTQISAGAGLQIATTAVSGVRDVLSSPTNSSPSSPAMPPR